MPNINDVARAAGVSKATVSRVLNNKEIVSENTKEKVYAAIEKLQYQPNLIGRMLRTSETQKVLVLLPDIANSFFSTVIRGIGAQAQEYGYTVMTGMTRSSLQKEESYIELLENRVIEGIILLSSNMDAERITELSKRRPIVQCSEYVVESDTSGVYINNEQAAYEEMCIRDKGYIRGGCSPIGMKKEYCTVIDNSCKTLSSMIFSGGKIGTQVEMAPQDLISLIKAKTAELTAK